MDLKEVVLFVNRVTSSFWVLLSCHQNDIRVKLINQFQLQEESQSSNTCFLPSLAASLFTDNTLYLDQNHLNLGEKVKVQPNLWIIFQ